jgi:hypothetical protein
VREARLYLCLTLLVLQATKENSEDCFFKVCYLICGREGCGGLASTYVLCFLFLRQKKSERLFL